ncbi:MAG: restriction endonuclease subunit S [Erysipelotrichaceae bacterium]|nr:restriction endonuclease subunit S [Erysipelotrichaceae bacterium]
MTEEKRLTLLDAHNWGEFYLGDLFSIQTGKAYNKNKMNIAETGLRHISRATSNHGIDCYADIEDYDEYVKYEPNCVTVSSIPYLDGTCAFYQDKEFCCGVGVNILTSPRLNKYNALYFCNCINQAVVGKYGMARSLGSSSLKEEVIKLPITPDGLPDYDFMEKYIKQLYDDFADCVCSFLKDK